MSQDKKFGQKAVHKPKGLLAKKAPRLHQGSDSGPTPDQVILQIQSLSHDGRGVARYNGKTCFISQAVPGDEVIAKIDARHDNFDEGHILQILQASSARTQAFCPHFGSCGGCQLQHIRVEEQAKFKQAHFFHNLVRQLKLDGVNLLPPLQLSTQGYRRRAKLVLVKDAKSKAPRLGFYGQNSHEVVDIESCPILQPELNALLGQDHHKLLEQAARKPKEVMLIQGDEGAFWADEVTHPLSYHLMGLTLEFAPKGFIQGHGQMNQTLVAQALAWLNLQPEDRLLDLFCGMGNFTLPLGQHIRYALGIEADADLIAQARHNAQINGLSHIEFFKSDLFAPKTDQAWLRLEGKKGFHKILLDPGRLGAKEICAHLGSLGAEKILYVSCNSATLIRDAKILLAQGYHLVQAQLLELFPHTTHTEVMVLFQK